MKERPIMFSGPMVRAILDGRKTQTRRVVKPQPAASPGYGYDTAFYADSAYSRAPGSTFAGRDVDPLRWWFADAGGPRTAHVCPYGAPGDRLWVRETWSKDALCVYPCPPIWYRADFLTAEDPSTYREHAGHCDAHKTGRPIAECFACAGLFRWRPSIFMVRRDSRLTLTVTSVRVERLQAISEADAMAEGVDRYAGACDHPRFGCDEIDCLGLTHRASFAALWDSINAERAPWASNPWVWVVEFARVVQP